MKYDDELNLKILENIDKKYAKFHQKLVPNAKILGVKVPILRKIAKSFLKYDDFLENITLNSFEKISVACYYVGFSCKDTKTLEKQTEFVLPFVDNWAVCDTFVSTLKILKTKEKQNFLPFVLKCLNSSSIFKARFAVVCLLSYFVEDKNVLNFLKQTSKIQCKDYYLDMAIAWFVSVCFVKCREKTLNFLKSKQLKKDVQNKSISKICDSFRVSKEDKTLVKTLKM